MAFPRRGGPSRVEESREEIDVEVGRPLRPAELAVPLTYNVPVDILPEQHAWIRTHRGSPSLVWIVNLSEAHAADLWINAGQAYSQQLTLPANDPRAFTDVRDYGGARLMVTNLSCVDAVLRLMVVGT